MTQGTITEYRAAKFTGWPTEDNMYAFPAVSRRLRTDKQLDRRARAPGQGTLLSHQESPM